MSSTISPQTQSVAERAKGLYAQRLQSDLEQQHPNQFVAIEPESGELIVRCQSGQNLGGVEAGQRPLMKAGTTENRWLFHKAGHVGFWLVAEAQHSA